MLLNGCCIESLKSTVLYHKFTTARVVSTYASQLVVIGTLQFAHNFVIPTILYPNTTIICKTLKKSLR